MVKRAQYLEPQYLLREYGARLHDKLGEGRVPRELLEDLENLLDGRSVTSLASLRSTIDYGALAELSSKQIAERIRRNFRGEYARVNFGKTLVTHEHVLEAISRGKLNLNKPMINLGRESMRAIRTYLEKIGFVDFI